MATAAALKRTAAARNRVEAVRARADTRTWVVNRRARTRRLIELGGLIDKSGVPAMLGDDDPDAVLLGALLSLKTQLIDEADTASQLALWRRRGQRAFRAEFDNAADASPDQVAP